MDPPGPITIAVDGSLRSFEAVQWGAARARDCGADIRILHPSCWRSQLVSAGGADMCDLTARQVGEDICRSAVDLASAIATDSRIHGEVVDGPPGSKLVDAAAEASHLVLPWSRGRLPRTLLGATLLQHVLARVPATVALLPRVEPARDPWSVAPGRVDVTVDGSSGDRPALTEAIRTAVAGNCQLHVICAAGARGRAEAELAVLAAQLPMPAVEPMTTHGQVIDAFARLAPTAHAVVCDRDQLQLARLRHGRFGRWLVQHCAGPLLLTRAGDAADAEGGESR